MIRVTFRNLSFDRGIEFRRSRGPVSIRVEGHAGKGKKGSDPVCAGVSALAQTMVLGIDLIAGVKQRFTAKEGLIITEFDAARIKPEKKEKLKVIMTLFFIGIVEIQRKHEGTISIDFDDIINKE